jgi:hypothetical protein
MRHMAGMKFFEFGCDYLSTGDRRAVYKICWGTAVVLFPNLFFDLFGLPV